MPRPGSGSRPAVCGTQRKSWRARSRGPGVGDDVSKTNLSPFSSSESRKFPIHRRVTYVCFYGEECCLKSNSLGMFVAGQGELQG